MLIGDTSKYLLQQTRSKAKMYEYAIPEERHIAVDPKAEELVVVTMGILAETSSQILSDLGPNVSVSTEAKKNLEFSGRFFDAFHDSEIMPTYSSYYMLLGASSYYFAGFIGSSKVMASKLNENTLDLNCAGLEKALLFLLTGEIDKLSRNQVSEDRYYKSEYDSLISSFCKWRIEASTFDYELIKALQDSVHCYASSREVLVCEVFLSIMVLKINSSARKLLSSFSELPEEAWEPYLKNNPVISELWPAQIKLGQSGILKGKSAVIQMPTSSGKTTSISLTIRSAFLSGRTSLVIIIAPFRALCREIGDGLAAEFSDDSEVSINEFSDIPDSDNIDLILQYIESSTKNIFVFTPEKLLYLLRQDKTLLAKVGLIIFDEAHLFDDSARGARFELLVSGIIGYINEKTQRILISAVIPNAKQINDWFTSGQGIVISDNQIKNTEKSIAIADWNYHQNIPYGYLYFLSNDDYEKLDFYVPRIISIQKLNKIGRETKTRYFPEVVFDKQTTNNNDIAIELARQVIHNGSVAIFCGRKISVNSILNRINEIKERGIDISAFSQNNELNENIKIANLIEANYGNDNIYYRSAINGIFPHHSGISDGIKLSIEYGIRKNLIQFVVCTSTLAQGVNLPIRYMIISSIYQADERIKVRDFHNLIGRAGRAGKYTEGTIIISESFVYSQKNNKYKKYKWNSYKDLLNADNSEDCSSQLLFLVQDFTIDFAWDNKSKLDIYKLALLKYNAHDEYDIKLKKLSEYTKSNYPQKEGYVYSIINRIESNLEAIESSILPISVSNTDELIELCLKNTLGYSLATNEEREKLINLFVTIYNYLVSKEPNHITRVVFSHTLLGETVLLELVQWVKDNYSNYREHLDKDDLLSVFVPVISKYSTNKAVHNLVSPDSLLRISKLWISGVSYGDIYRDSVENNMMKYFKQKNVIIELDDIISICDNGLGYSATLILNAICELTKSLFNDTDVCNRINRLSKNLRYGLPSMRVIHIYELGFSDRHIAMIIEELIESNITENKKQLIDILRKRKNTITNSLVNYPSIYQEIISSL